MEIKGPADLQKILPAQRVGALRKAVSALGYGHAEMVLNVKKQAPGTLDGTATVRIHSWGDTEIAISIQGDNHQIFSASLESLRPEDRGNMQAVQVQLVRKLREFANPAAASQNSGPVRDLPQQQTKPFLKVFALKDLDERGFPVLLQLKLEKALARLDVLEDVILRFERRQSGTAETVGIDFMDVENKTITLSFQSTAQSGRFICHLTLRTEQSGAWLRGELEKALATLTNGEDDTPSRDSEALTNGAASRATGGATMPVTPQRRTDHESDEDDDSGAGAVRIEKVLGSGFTKRRDRVDAYIAALRARFPDGRVATKDATRVLADFVEPKEGSHPNQGLGIIVVTLRRMGLFLETSDPNVYAILPAGQEPVPVTKNGIGRKLNGHAFALADDDPAMSRLIKVNRVVDAVARSKADVAGKKAELEELRSDRTSIDQKIAALEAEIKDDEARLPSEDALADLDTALSRFDNFLPANPLNEGESDNA